MLFFGIIRENTGLSQLTVSGVKTKDELFQKLLLKFPFLSTLPLVVAINQEVATKNTALNDGDEVAIMPPYAGG